MKNVFEKGLSVVLVVATLFSITAQAAFAAPVESTVEGIVYIDKNVTDTNAYLKYYMTVDGKTNLITESAKIEDETIFVDSSSVEVDENFNPIIVKDNKVPGHPPAACCEEGWGSYFYARKQPYTCRFCND